LKELFMVEILHSKDAKMVSIALLRNANYSVIRRTIPNP